MFKYLNHTVLILLSLVMFNGCENIRKGLDNTIDPEDPPDDKEYTEVANKWNVFDFNGKKKSVKSGSALLEAVVANQKDIVKLLIEKGADINVKDKNGWTPLIWAIHYGRLKIANYLISHGANLNTKTKDGKTPLSMAITEGYTELAKLLIKKGADVNQKIGNEPSILCLAIKEKREELAKLILTKNICIKGTPRGNEFPLHISCASPHRLRQFDKFSTYKKKIKELIASVLKEKNQAVIFSLTPGNCDIPVLIPCNMSAIKPTTKTDQYNVKLQYFLENYSHKILLYLIIPHNLDPKKFKVLAENLIGIIKKYSAFSQVIIGSENLQFLRVLRNKSNQLLLTLHTEKREKNVDIIKMLHAIKAFAYVTDLKFAKIEVLKSLHKAGLMCFVIKDKNKLLSKKEKDILNLADGIIQ